MAEPLNILIKYLIHPSIHYVYESRIRRKMEFLYHILVGTGQSSRVWLDRVQKAQRLVMADELFSTLQNHPSTD